MEELNTSKLEEEVAKVAGEDTPSESTTEETSTEEKTEETQSQEETSEDTTSLKSEEETKETEEKVETEDDRFDKHPRWQKLRQDLETSQGRARVADELEEAIGGLGVDEIKRLRSAGELLQKHPEAAKKVQKVLDEHDFEGSERDSKLDEVTSRQQELEDKLLLRDYDDSVNKLISENKVDKEVEPFLREILENRVMNAKLKDLEKVPGMFDKALKDVDSIRRKTLASHIKTKKTEPKVPASTTQKGKVIAQKSEATDLGSIRDELADGIRKAHQTLPKE